MKVKTIHEINKKITEKLMTFNKPPLLKLPPNGFDNYLSKSKLFAYPLVNEVDTVLLHKDGFYYKFLYTFLFASDYEQTTILNNDNLYLLIENRYICDGKYDEQIKALKERYICLEIEDWALLFIVQVPDKYRRDYNFIKKGLYDCISEDNKKKIVSFFDFISNSAYNFDVNQQAIRDWLSPNGNDRLAVAVAYTDNDQEAYKLYQYMRENKMNVLSVPDTKTETLLLNKKYINILKPVI